MRPRTGRSHPTWKIALDALFEGTEEIRIPLIVSNKSCETFTTDVQDGCHRTALSELALSFERPRFLKVRDQYGNEEDD